jgi:hypothetical protein
MLRVVIFRWAGAVSVLLFDFGPAEAARAKKHAFFNCRDIQQGADMTSRAARAQADGDAGDHTLQVGASG